MRKPAPEFRITEIGASLRRGEAVRRELAEGGVLNIERPPPYLFVRRARPGADDEVTPRLLRGEASYLLWAGPEASTEFRIRCPADEAVWRADRALDPGFAPDAQLRPDVVGLQVSRGDLLIDERVRLDPVRVEALLQHEVGTHILTHVNGAAQPLRQLAAGWRGTTSSRRAWASWPSTWSAGSRARACAC